MYVPSISGADAPTVSAASASGRDYETVRHLMFGSPGGIRDTVQNLHKRGYADVNDWSKPIATGRPNEMMSILTMRITPAAR